PAPASTGPTLFPPPPRAASRADSLDDLRPSAVVDEMRSYRRASRRHLVQHRHVEVRVERHRERARNRRRAHHQLVRLTERLTAKPKPLRNAEAMLLVDDREPELR